MRKRTLWNTTIKDQVGLPKSLMDIDFSKVDLSKVLKRTPEMDKVLEPYQKKCPLNLNISVD